jgi:acetylornithine deacetylase
MSDLVELVKGLVEIDSINPDLIPGAAGEAELAGYVADWAERAGLDVEVEEAAPGRPNVIATARGSGGGRALLLNAHMDTVGVDTMEAPFDARVEQGRLYGRGSYDMKGSLAAILVVAAEAKRLGLRGDVVVAAVADEEVASIGTESLVASGRRFDAAVVAEPTELGRGDRAQGLRRLRDRDPRPRRPRFAARPRRGRDRPHGACPYSAGRAGFASAREPDAPAARHRLRPRLADRRRAGVLQLPERCLLTGERRTLRTSRSKTSSASC